MASRTTPSLGRRALLAVLLTIGFYTLALAMAVGLALIPVFEYRVVKRLHIQLAIGCWAGAAAIVWAILPRWDRFEPPGPRLSPQEQPRLFAEISAIAQQLGQTAPAEVYLTQEMNAGVFERGGILGLGRRRVMLIGLALLQTLSLSQFRFVLAHEFGHYHGGDTALGPWIYRTRAALERSVVGLRERSWLQAPFIWYWKMFMRLTQAVARQQEFAADALAARLVGSRPSIESLRRLGGLSLAFQGYWLNEYTVAVNAGFMPSFGEGLAQFLQGADVKAVMARADQFEAEEAETDAYDSHPSTRERIAALADLPPGGGTEDEPAAVTLLEDVPRVEQALLASLVKPEHYKQLQPIAWDEMGAAVYLPMWERRAALFASALAGVTPLDLPEFLAQPHRLAQLLREQTKNRLPQEDYSQAVVSIVGAALATRLAQQGWALDVTPGAPVTLTRGDETVQPFGGLPALAEDAAAAEAWRQQCARVGIATLDLGQEVTTA